MAKKSKLAKNQQRRKAVAKYAARRAELKAIIKNKRSTPEQIQDAVDALAKLPRDASPIRVRNRCNLTGRPRAYYRKFGLSRIALRDLALRGELPGVTKSSW
jgi:small subunit ribosomal protein S14